MIQQLHVNTPAKATKLNKLYKALQNGTSNTVLLVKYYLDGCPACIHFQPIWKNIISLAKKQKRLPDVVFVEVNAKMLDDLRIPKAEQFPTIKLFNLNNPQGIKFNQDRTPENLLHFIKQHVDKIKKRGRNIVKRRSTRRRASKKQRTKKQRTKKQRTKKHYV